MESKVKWLINTESQIQRCPEADSQIPASFPTKQDSHDYSVTKTFGSLYEVSYR